MKKSYQPNVLLILDGWGIAPKGPGNAVEIAHKPHFDRVWKKYPHTQLCASESCVGLPDGQAGNSEAGHMNIGAGRVVYQDNVIINRAIADKSFFTNIAFESVLDHVKANHSRLHLMGMLSDGDSPHSSINHLIALVDWAKKKKVEKVFIHLFTDGRDSPQHCAERLIHDLFLRLEKFKNGTSNYELASLMGRFYAMDRGKNWDRTKRAYDCLTGTDKKTLKFSYYKDAIEHSYNKNLTDEYLEPVILDRHREGFENSRISDKDAVIYFNLRSDRARQLAKCFVQENFMKDNPGVFRRKKILKNILFCAMTYFGPDLSRQLVTAYPGAEMIATMPFVMNSYRQLYIAETEKFAHVTYFINGGYPDPVFGEDRIRVPSVIINNYADKPEMSAKAITKNILKVIASKKYDFIVANFANADMVGHTGNLAATIKAVETVDACVGAVISSVLSKKGNVFITADHGNAEKMIDEKTGEIFTEHTTNPVPFIIVGHQALNLSIKPGNLGDIAPTIYDYLGVRIPGQVKGQSLIKVKKK